MLNKIGVTRVNRLSQMFKDRIDIFAPIGCFEKFFCSEGNCFKNGFALPQAGFDLFSFIQFYLNLVKQAPLFNCVGNLRRQSFQ